MGSKKEREKKVPTYTEVFGKTLVELGEKDEKIVAITAAMPDGTGLSYFAERFPERFFDVGIAEQHAVTFAAGLAMNGLKPIVAIYSTFLQRSFDQIIHDVCLQKLPVVFVLDRAGLVSDDGPTHQGIFDLSYLRLIPNIVVSSPKDEAELRDLLYTAINYPGPFAIRYPKGKGYGVKLSSNFNKIEIGKAEILEEGEDVLFLAIGSMVYTALGAYNILKEKGIYAKVVNLRFLKPLDIPLLEEIFSKFKYVFTLEENIVTGGLFGAISEFVSKFHFNVNLHPIALPEKFIEHGNVEILKEIYGLKEYHVVNEVLRVLNKTRVEG